MWFSTGSKRCFSNPSAHSSSLRFHNIYHHSQTVPLKEFSNTPRSIFCSNPLILLASRYHQHFLKFSSCPFFLILKQKTNDFYHIDLIEHFISSIDLAVYMLESFMQLCARRDNTRRSFFYCSLKRTFFGACQCFISQYKIENRDKKSRLSIN